MKYIKSEALIKHAGVAARKFPLLWIRHCWRYRVLLFFGMWCVDIVGVFMSCDIFLGVQWGFRIVREIMLRSLTVNKFCLFLSFPLKRNSKIPEEEISNFSPHSRSPPTTHHNKVTPLYRNKTQTQINVHNQQH